MRDPFFSFVIEIIGAFIVWASKGFKGKLEDEMSRPYESNKKSWRNALISFAFIFIIFAITSKYVDNKKKEITESKFEITIEK